MMTAGEAHAVPPGHGRSVELEVTRMRVLIESEKLEHMFLELATLSGDAIRDPAVLAAISARYDSIPTHTGGTA